MQSTNRPGKFLVPFAQNDSARVELPATTADAARASQSLGFPPATGLPPEAGGVPPQLEDMNGGLNQISRGVWWALGGGRYPYDSAWANDTLIGGYARGAVVPAALGAGQIGLGDWYNNTEANTANPDTDGTGWVPGYQYGATALTGLTGGTVTLTPAQAAKRVITVAGTLTSNLVLVVPAWVYDWTVSNNTGGAFTVTVKNAATPGAIVPQNGAPTPIRCDGSACSLLAANIAPATSSTQALQLGQATGRLLATRVFTANATYTPSAGAVTYEVEMVGGGGGGGGAPATDSTQNSAGAGGGSGGYVFKAGLVSAVSGSAIVVGAGGNSASAGGASTFAGASAGGGGGGTVGAVSSKSVVGPLGGSSAGAATGGDVNAPGAIGLYALYAQTPISGTGAVSFFGGGGAGVAGASGAGNAALAPGAGGGGALSLGPALAYNGGVGRSGIVIIREYA